MKAVSFDYGLRKIKGLIHLVERKPVLCAVYGWPHSGKTYLIDKIASYFRRLDKGVAAYSSGPNPSIFENFVCFPEIVGDIYLFHCGWVRDNICFPGGISKHEDPNFLAESIFHRSLDLNIGIYNPYLYGIPPGSYNIIIRNDHAQNKEDL